MKYLKIKWIHAFPDEPVWLYSEIDGERRETRKVEVFADGNMGFAEKLNHTSTTKLGEEPLPSATDICADPQFELSYIQQSEFELVWENATSSQ